MCLVREEEEEEEEKEEKVRWRYDRDLDLDLVVEEEEEEVGWWIRRMMHISSMCEVVWMGVSWGGENGGNVGLGCERLSESRDGIGREMGGREMCW